MAIFLPLAPLQARIACYIDTQYPFTFYIIITCPLFIINTLYLSDSNWFAVFVFQHAFQAGLDSVAEPMATSWKGKSWNFTWER